MPDRPGPRFALELLYLIALAVALAFTNLRAPAIAGVMLLGWALVVGIEWAGIRARAHYGAGLPPGWRVPPTELPPAQPLELGPAYPESERDEQATWIASAELRVELLGEWPVAVLSDDPATEDTQDATPDPWLERDLPVLPPVLVEAEPVFEPAPALERVPEHEPEAPPAVVAAPRVERVARYHVDPLAEPERRRFGRTRELPSVEVPAGAPTPRPLPGDGR